MWFEKVLSVTPYTVPRARTRAYADLADFGTLGNGTPSLQQPSHAATVAAMVEAAAKAAAAAKVPSPAEGKGGAREGAAKAAVPAVPAARRGRAAIDDRRAAVPRDRC